MKEQILTLTLILISLFSQGQTTSFNQPNPQLKFIADQLFEIKDYNADCYLTMSLQYGGTMNSATTMTLKKIASDTLCGFYFYFKTHKEFIHQDGDFTALISNAFYSSINGKINKTSIIDKPEEFKTRKIENGFIPSIFESSSFFNATPFQIGKLINDTYSKSEAITIHRPDTIINGKSCFNFILKDKIYKVVPRKTVLCFDKNDLSPTYFKQTLNEGVHAQYKIIEYKNTQINIGLKASFFTEESLFGKSLANNSTNPINPPSLKVGQIAPQWTLPVLYREQKISSDKLKGKYILLEFTGTWCGHCWDAVKTMNKLEELYGNNEKLEIFSVFGGEIDTPDRIKKFAEKENIKSTILYSAKEIIEKYKVVGFPTFFIIDPVGKLIYIQKGYSKSVETEIIKMINEKIK